MRKIKFMSLLLAFVMLFSITCSSVLTSYADEVTAADSTTAAGDTTSAATGDSTVTTTEGAESGEEGEEGEAAIDYTAEAYATPEAKLETMVLKYSNYGYELYYHEFTGEVAVKNTTTGQILFTNPYDIGSTASSASVKADLLSQIILKYKDNDKEYEFNSFTHAAQSSQIQLKAIKGGIRVEYAIGKTAKRKLVPRCISQMRFEEHILSKISSDFERNKITAFYTLIDINNETLTKKEKDEILKQYPIAEEMPVYVLVSDISDKELDTLEGYVKKFTDYTMEDMIADHEETGYVLEDTSPPLFKMALEYYIEEDGIKVRLPANGIQFDSSIYKLTSVSILPYFGAGNYDETGYTFIPDGSGTLVRFEDVGQNSVTITGKMYGNDFGFHEVTGGNMETWRIPVYGVIRDTAVTHSKNVSTVIVDEAGNPILDSQGNQQYDWTTEKEVTKSTEGYVAIIEEGASLSQLTSEHGGTLHKYQSVFMTVFPRQRDSYPLDGITVSGASATYEVEAQRKYTGNYTLKIVMLKDEDADYVGMAKAYRNYLEKEGIINKTVDDSEDIPLYLETFGDIETTQRIIGMPVTVKTTLTTFEQAKTMLSELMDEGITNINLRYLGWCNGGMVYTPPTQVDVESKLGGDKGFQDLVDFTKENNIGFFPDFDFTYVQSDGWFDGFNYKDDAAQTVEGKAALRKTYDPIAQTFNNRGPMIISANVLSSFFEKMNKDYSEFENTGISLGSIGDSLNTDHNEDMPINREDSRKLVTDMLGEVNDAGYEILTTGGNSYVYQYASHILDVPLESSSRLAASEDVPFVGIVLHGYINFAGEALNLAGDYKTTLLKTIENGADPYFVLSYDNTSELKNTEFSDYFSVAYSIWYDDLISIYKEINSDLKQVKNALIDAHEFVDYRVVKVTYDNGICFLLNYNNQEVTVGNDTKIAPMGYLVGTAEEFADIKAPEPEDENADVDAAADDGAPADSSAS
ncbi:MAG: DUF5696 domain-containing protein [Firmicutes bacterium]|nr:DUF5696 domain-containing protein [Bacillota bacterium]